MVKYLFLYNYLHIMIIYSLYLLSLLDPLSSTINIISIYPTVIMLTTITYYMVNSLLNIHIMLN